MATIVPAIPGSCAHRPTVGGVVAPFVNIRLADGGVDFRSPDTKRYTMCWTNNLCQTCGDPLGLTAVLFGGPRQLASLRFDEPPLCPPCAVYASQACPMVAGRQARYADRQRHILAGHHRRRNDGRARPGTAGRNETWACVPHRRLRMRRFRRFGP